MAIIKIGRFAFQIFNSKSIKFKRFRYAEDGLTKIYIDEDEK